MSKITNSKRGEEWLKRLSTCLAGTKPRVQFPAPEEKKKQDDSR
jgi:hypothetical protein